MVVPDDPKLYEKAYREVDPVLVLVELSCHVNLENCEINRQPALYLPTKSQLFV